MKPNQRKYVLFTVLAAIVVALDQWTKVLARTHLAPLGRAHKVVVEGFFNLRYSENSGVAFGFLQTLPGGRILLTVVALAAFGLVVYYLHKTAAHHLRMHVALGLIGGGAIGNLIDRITLGRVTDFIVWHYKQHEWPAFNIADAALCVGVGLMALDMFRPEKQASSDSQASPDKQRS
jgi:signal peptidase II